MSEGSNRYLVSGAQLRDMAGQPARLIATGPLFPQFRVAKRSERNGRIIHPGDDLVEVIPVSGEFVEIRCVCRLPEQIDESHGTEPSTLNSLPEPQIVLDELSDIDALIPPWVQLQVPVDRGPTLVRDLPDKPFI